MALALLGLSLFPSFTALVGLSPAQGSSSVDELHQPILHYVRRRSSQTSTLASFDSASSLSSPRPPVSPSRKPERTAWSIISPPSTELGSSELQIGGPNHERNLRMKRERKRRDREAGLEASMADRFFADRAAAGDNFAFWTGFSSSGRRRDVGVKSYEELDALFQALSTEDMRFRTDTEVFKDSAERRGNPNNFTFYSVGLQQQLGWKPMLLLNRGLRDGQEPVSTLKKSAGNKVSIHKSTFLNGEIPVIKDLMSGIYARPFVVVSVREHGCELIQNISELVALEGKDGQKHRPCCVDAFERFKDYSTIITKGPELDQWGKEVAQQVGSKCGGWKI